MEENLNRNWTVELGSSTYTVSAVTNYEARTKGAKLFKEKHPLVKYSVSSLAREAKASRLDSNIPSHTIATRRKVFSLVEHFLERKYNTQFKTEYPIGFHRADLLGYTDSTIIIVEIKVRLVDALKLPVQLLSYKLELESKKEVILYSVLTNRVADNLSRKGFYYAGLVKTLSLLGIHLLIVSPQSETVKEIQ